MHKKSYKIITLFATTIVNASLFADPNPSIYCTREEAKQYCKDSENFDASKHHLFKQLEQTYGKNKPLYLKAEVIAVVNPQKTPPSRRKPARGERTDVVPNGAVSASRLPQLLAEYKTFNPSSKATTRAVESVYGNLPWYTYPEILDVAKNGSTVQPPKPKSPPQIAAEMERDREIGISENNPKWKPLLIRHDWTDVLPSEDLSQPTTGATKTSDLVGAIFSFTHDGKSQSDTWSTVGSIILPWVYVDPKGKYDLMLAPSISLNRISSNVKSTNEIDQLTHRIGIYSTIFRPISWIDEVQIRAAGVYLTDTSYRARMPGFEVDLEPRMKFDDLTSDFHRCPWKIGYKNIVIPKKDPLLADKSDNSLFDYQIRIWLHMEGGDIQDIGKSWVATRGSFFRLGPTAQLRINFPAALKGVALTSQYSYLADLQGASGHNSLLSETASFTLIQTSSSPGTVSNVVFPKLTLNLSYTKGGVIFTKQDVDTFTIGLGALF